MANTNQEAIKFCNEKARVAADKLASTYYFVKQVKNEWYANNLGTLFPTGSGTLVEDGSSVDGRHPIINDDVVLLINRCDELVADYEATNNAKLNTILNIAVNIN